MRNKDIKEKIMEFFFTNPTSKVPIIEISPQKLYKQYSLILSCISIMRKKVNQKLLFVFAFSIVFLVVASVFAAGQDNESADDDGGSENGSDSVDGESGQAGPENQNSGDKELTADEVSKIGEI